MLKSFNHFEINEIKVFVDITLSTFNFANVSHGLSGIQWQTNPIDGSRPQASNTS